MRPIDADALFEKVKESSKDAGFYTPIYNGFLAGIVNAPTIEIIEFEALLKQIYRERSRLNRVDADFENRMGGYNPSSFTAGFIYALERMMGWVTSLKGESKTDG